jgi:hypothetical protein
MYPRFDTDSDPRIRTTGIRIRNLDPALFFMSFKMTTKISLFSKFFAYYLL